MKTYVALLLAVASLSCAAVTNAADDEFGTRASWKPPTRAEVLNRIDQWLADRHLSQLEQLKFDALWPIESSDFVNDDLLNDVAVTIALLMPAAQDIIDICREERQSPVAPQFEILADEATPPFVRNNLLLLYGRWLVQNELHDEALSILDQVTLEDVVDPASLLFYRSVAHHGLFNKEQCLLSLGKLLENAETIPRRYATLAQLMTADLQTQQKDKVLKTLDEVARIMADIERRQRLYRAGKKVRGEEDEVIAKLDELIKELEQSGGGGGGGAGGSAPTTPMQDSSPGGGTGPGNVDPRQITPGGDWGELPPKQREAAMAELAKDLPGHYREVIEEYFRNLARDPDQP